MTLTLWLSLVAACLIISLTPGAGAVNTMTTSLLYGWRRSFFTVLGQQLALLTQIAIVAAGLGVIVAQSPILFDVIRYGCYQDEEGTKDQVERSLSTHRVREPGERFCHHRKTAPHNHDVNNNHGGRQQKVLG